MTNRKLGFGPIVVSLLAFTLGSGGCKKDAPPPVAEPNLGGSSGKGGSTGKGGSGGRGGTGGGGGRGGSAGTDAMASSDTGGEVQLKVAWWGSPTRHERTIKVINEFMKKYPHIKITFAHYMSTNTEYWPTLRGQAANNTLPDIMQHDHAYLEEWTDAGHIIPLDSLTADGSLDLKDVPASLVEGGKIKGKLMGVNLGSNTQAFVLDVDAFQRAGIALPPDNWTWTDFERIALEIKTKLNIWGYGVGLHGYTPGWKAIYLSKGGWVFSPQNNAIGYSDDKPWVDHWKMMLRLQAAGAIPTRMQEKTEYPTSNVETYPLAVSKSAMEQIHSNQLVGLWTAAGTARNLKMLPIPRTPGGGSSVYIKPSQYWSITKTSKFPKEAALFISYFTNDIAANEILLAERGVPVNTKVLEALKPKLDKMALDAFNLIDRVTKDSPRALPAPDPAAWTNILNMVYIPQVTDPVLAQQTTPEAATALFRVEANRLLAGGAASDAGVDAKTDAGAPADAAEAGTSPEVTPPVDGAAGGMSFFVTSVGSGINGGNLGGLAGADAKCEALAAAVGAGGKGWRAFLSTTAEGATPGQNARDRIGTGPWRNQKGQVIAVDVAGVLIGAPANLVMDEKGQPIPKDWHEVLTGTRDDGTAYTGRTCNNWTSNSGTVRGQVGIADEPDVAERISSHDSGCSQAALLMDGNEGRFYCFASMP